MTRLSSPTSHDSKTDLLEAAKAVVQERNEKAGQAAARRMQPEVRKRVGVLSLLGLGGLLLLVLQPGWLAGPKRLPPESAAVARPRSGCPCSGSNSGWRIFSSATGGFRRRFPKRGNVPGLGYEALPQQEFRLRTGGRIAAGAPVIRFDDSVSRQQSQRNQEPGRP